MRSTRNLLAAGVILMMLAHPVFAQTKGASMGRMLSVVSDGPFDAGRNPALLMLQQETHVIGAYYQYRPLRKYDVEGSISTGSVEYDETSTTAMSGNLAYSLKLDKLVLGLSVSRNELKDSYALTSAKTSIAISQIPSVIGQYEEGKTKEINPVFGASLAIPISSNSSLGAQLLAGYNYLKESGSSSLSQNSAITNFIQSKRRTQESLDAELGFGYQYSTPQTQLGFLLRSGKLSVESEKMSFRFSNMLEDSDKFSSFWSYQGGINITAGGYRRFASFIALSLEASFTFESNYPGRDVEMIFFNTPYPYLEKTKYDVSVKNIIYLKGGVELNPLPQLAITLGGGYTYLAVSKRQKNTIRDKGQETSSEICFFTGGLHYALTPKISLSLIAQATMASSDIDQEENNLLLRMNTDLVILDAGIAATFAF